MCEPAEVKSAIEATLGRKTRLGPANLQKVADAVNTGQVDAAAKILHSKVANLSPEQAGRIANQLREGVIAETVYKDMIQAARRNAAVSPNEGRRVVEGAYHPSTGVKTRASGGGEPQDPAAYPHLTFPNPPVHPGGRPPTTCGLPRAANDVLATGPVAGPVYVGQGGFFVEKGSGRLMYRSICENCGGLPGQAGTVALNPQLHLLPVPPAIPRNLSPGAAVEFIPPAGW